MPHLEDDRESASRYLSIFIDESQQTLDELTEALLALEAGGGRESIEQLFVAAHRIKGSAASIGLNRVAKLAHLMEDLLQILVDDGRTLAPEIADGMLACTDGLRQYVNALKERPARGRPLRHLGPAAAWTPDPHAATFRPPRPRRRQGPLRPLRRSAQGDAAAPKGEDAEAKAEHSEERSDIDRDLRQRIAATLHDQEHDNVLVGRIVFEPNLPLVGLKAQLICSKLSNLGNIRYFDPPVADIENLDEIAALCFGIATERSPEEVQRLLARRGRPRDGGRTAGTPRDSL